MLQPKAERDDSPGRLPLRPEPHSATDGGRALPAPGGPVAAVTFGTSVQDPAAMGSLVRSIASTGVSVLATVEPGEFDVDESLRHRLHTVGFVPLARLLPSVDVVVSAGGTGTLPAALALGRPRVGIRVHHRDRRGACDTACPVLTLRPIGHRPQQLLGHRSGDAVLGQGNAEHGGDQRGPSRRRCRARRGQARTAARPRPPRLRPRRGAPRRTTPQFGTGLGPVLAVAEATAGFRDRLGHGRADPRIRPWTAPSPPPGPGR
jgi:hypothetical protein